MSVTKTSDLPLGMKQYTVRHIPLFGMVVMYRVVTKDFVLDHVWSPWKRAGLSDLTNVVALLAERGKS